MTTPIMHLDCDGFADALADYLEGDASESVRAAVEAHAASCPSCAALLADLRGISVSAASLPTLMPSRDLWSGIAERIDARVIPFEAPVAATHVTRRTWLRPALAAAALVGITAGITHYATRASLTPASPAPAVAVAAKQPVVAPTVVATNATISSTATEQAAEPTHAPSSHRTVAPSERRSNTSARLASTAPGADVADPVFNSEISKLRQILKERRSQLDPKTVAVLEQSVAVMDSAIAQSRAALKKDPASGFLATQLNHSLEKKVELLRTAALLPSRT